MIITHLRAINVLKYARLELNNLPGKGLIAITGPNESGKTAVVEAICFALFGRTFSHGEENLPKIIRWGEENCRIEMGFEAGDGNHYLVRRALDRDGVHAAELYRGSEKAPFAKGPNTVRDAIVGASGFDYQQYLDALYLAQMEISAPHPQSETIREIAGTRQLEAVAAELEREIQIHSAEIDETNQRIASLRARISELDAGEAAAARLDEQEQTLRGAMAKRRQAIEALRALSANLRQLRADLQNEISELTRLDTDTPIQWWRTELQALEEAAKKIHAACQAVEADSALCTERPLQHKVDDLGARLAAVDALEERASALKHRMEVLTGTVAASSDETLEPPIPTQIARSRSRLVGPRALRAVLGLAFLLLALAAIASWGMWWLAQPRVPGALGDGLVQWVQQLWPDWPMTSAHGPLIAAMVSTGGALLLWIWSIGIDRRIERRREEIRHLEERHAALLHKVSQLGALAEKPLTEAVDTLRLLGEPELEEALTALEQGPASVFLDPGALHTYLDEWRRLRSELEDGLSDLREALAERIGSLEEALQASEQALEALNAKRQALTERREQAGALLSEVRALESRMPEHERAVRVRELALQLVRGTCRSVYQRFNNVLSKFTGEVLPRFTEERYRQVQISDDLTLRVFVTEKNDFAELEELSSGTQRQILLAVRLAMAKALVDASGQTRQFLILDEPFAFFDRERIHLTLRALPDLDRRITQIWIISQEFPSYDRFKLNIRCNRDTDELAIGEKAGASLFSFGGRSEPT